MDERFVCFAPNGIVGIMEDIKSAHSTKNQVGSVYSCKCFIGIRQPLVGYRPLWFRDKS